MAKAKCFTQLAAGSMRHLMLCVLLFLYACGGNEAPLADSMHGAAPVKVPIAKAEMSEEYTIHEAVGVVKAKTASTISSKLMGTIESIPVKEGDRFSKGDLLLTIDPRQVSARLHQAEAALEEARQAHAAAVSAFEMADTEYQLADKTYARYLQLVENAAASQQEFDEIKAKHLQAQAASVRAEAMVSAAGSRVEQAEAGVAAVKVNRQDATILAPYDGWVTAKLADEGSLAAPGTPLLSIESFEAFRIDTVIPEKYIGYLSVDQTVKIHIDALKGTSLKGAIQAIAPSADNSSHTFLVRVSLPKDQPVLSGMFARIHFPLQQSGRILVPGEAVIRNGQLTGLYLVDEQQIARFRLVRLGKKLGKHYEVLSGLKLGHRYVADPPAQLVDGMRIEQLRDER